MKRILITSFLVAASAGPVLAETITLDSTELSSAVLPLSNLDVGELFLRNQLRIGRKCKTNENLHGLPGFAFQLEDKDPQYFDRRTPMRVGVQLKTSADLSRGANFPKMQVTYGKYARDERNSLLSDLGQYVKTLIPRDSWPCGTHTIKITVDAPEKVAEDVKFYKSKETKEIVCVLPDDMENVVRLPGTCRYEPILQELPGRLCQMLIGTERARIERELEKSSPDLSKLAADVFEPKFSDYSSDFKRRLETSRYLRTHPNLVNYLLHARIPPSDLYVGMSGVNVFDYFLTKKHFLEGSEVNPSPELNDHLAKHAAANEKAYKELLDKLSDNAKLPQNEQVVIPKQIYVLPSRTEIHDDLRSQVQYIEEIWASQYDFSVDCEEDAPRIRVKYN